MDVELIIHNSGQLITCRGDNKPRRGAAAAALGIIENGAVAIADGVIVATGPSEDIIRSYNAAAQLNAEGRVVCPGFVDPHTHVVYAGDRIDEFEMRIRGASYMDIMAAGGGIAATTLATRNATADEIEDETEIRLDSMLSLGTTTAEVKSGYGLNIEWFATMQ